MNISHHSLNSKLSKDPETHLTSKEEMICFLYTTDEWCKGDKVKTLLRANYSAMLSGATPDAEMAKVVNEVFSNKHVKKRIDQIVKDRDGAFVFDRLDVLKNYKQLYEMTTQGDETDLKTAKAINDSMAKVLGMFDDIKKVDTGTDPAKLAKAAYARGREAGRKQRETMKPLEIIQMKKRNGTE